MGSARVDWTQFGPLPTYVLVMMTMMSARLLTLCAQVKIATFTSPDPRDAKRNSGHLHPRKLMSISRSISSRKIVNLHIINICCPKKWEGQNTLRPPTSKSGGGLVPAPVHPMIDAHACRRVGNGEGTSPPQPTRVWESSVI